MAFGFILVWVKEKEVGILPKMLDQIGSPVSKVLVGECTFWWSSNISGHSYTLLLNPSALPNPKVQSSDHFSLFAL